MFLVTTDVKEFAVPGQWKKIKEINNQTLFIITSYQAILTNFRTFRLSVQNTDFYRNMVELKGTLVLIVLLYLSRPGYDQMYTVKRL